MKHFTKICMGLALMMGVAGVAYVANNDTIIVNYEVKEITEISINEESLTLTLDAMTAGFQPISTTDIAHYKITTICAPNSKKITAAINEDLPAGLMLKLNCTAPAGAISEGKKNITATATDVVTGVSSVIGASLNMALNATVSDEVAFSASRTFVLTIADT